MIQTQILLVEDENLIALDLTHRLTNLGYKVVGWVPSGEEAVVLAAKLSPDLILMDIKLKGRIDGIEAAEQIKAQQDIPIIYLTAFVDKATIQRAKITVPFGYLVKPVDERELSTIIEMALHKHLLEQQLKQYRLHLEELVTERTAELARSNQLLQEEINRRQKAEEQYLHDAFHDGLTGLPNRALFVEHLERSLGHARRSGNYLFAVLMLDLDRFKVINDSLGHTVGDQLLITTARRLESCTRPGDTVARLGGDEFAVLLDDIKHVDEARSIADQIHQQIASPINLEAHEITITTSIGIVADVKEYYRPAELMRDADTAMYQAKAQGGSQHEIFDIQMYTQAVKRLRLETELRQAIEREELEVHYQPIVSLANKRITGVEALLRWVHPQLGNIAPSEFIPLAEETGLIVALGQWLLERSCAQIKNWHLDGYWPLRLAINVSMRQFQTRKLAETVKLVLSDTRLAPEALDIEITESVAMTSTELDLVCLRKLSTMGVQFTIDDFGTGYSSFSRLKTLPVSILKIDKSLIKDLVSDPDSQAIVTAIVAMAHSLKMKVIAEGVETTAQRDWLQAQQCDEMQGFLISPPVSTGALTEHLRKNWSSGGPSTHATSGG
ncbi:MAG: EAL domain-containing protein [Anaerolineae bacterium]|nr:EAL domain-containing protein [Anaerolineae bacterium]